MEQPNLFKQTAVAPSAFKYFYDMTHSKATTSSKLTLVIYSVMEPRHCQTLCTQYLVKISLYPSAQQTQMKSKPHMRHDKKASPFYGITHI